MTAPTVTALNAGQITRRGNDVPLIVSLSGLRLGSEGTGWDLRANDDGLFNTADASASGYAVSRVHDGERITAWRFGAADTVTYILADAGAGNAITADCVIFEGQGASLLSEVRVRCSGGLNANALDGDAETLCTETVTQDLHAIFLNSSYQARYWEIRLTSTGSQVHQLSQLWLGQQRQFDEPPDTPYDRQRTMSEYESSATRGGADRRVLLYRGRAHKRGTWQFWSTEGLAFIRSVEGEDESNGWSRAFWYAEQPGTDPDDVVFVKHFGSELNLPSEIGTDEIPDAIWDGDMREQLPRGTSAGA